MRDRPVKILVVDDSKSFITHITSLLRKMGFSKVIIAEEGLEALKLIKIWLPDVVMLNINMPGMDGISVLRFIKEDVDLSELPVIMVTSDTSKGTEDQCRQMGCADYLRKPVDIPSLHKALQESITETVSSRRINLRTGFEKKVGVTLDGATEVLPSLSLSEGGIYITRESPFPLGTELEIILPIRDSLPLHLKGTVIYLFDHQSSVLSLPPGMGIEFRDLFDDNAELLRTYITELITGRGGRPSQKH